MDEGSFVAIVTVLVTLVNHVGVLAVIEVVDADIDGAGEGGTSLTRLELAVEVDTNIHAVIVGHAEIVAFPRLSQIAVPAFGINIGIIVGSLLSLSIFLHAQRGGVAGAVDPCGAEINRLVEFVAGNDAEVVTPVVLGRKWVTVVDGTPIKWS